MKRSVFGLAVSAALLMAGAVRAEVINTTEGSKTVIESKAPLGTPLTYDSGGDGLTGFAGSWPVALTPAAAASDYDHYWLQFDPAIVWSSGSPLKQVFAIPGVDHGPIPQENLEFIIWGSKDKVTWEEGTILKIYRDGFDTANTDAGHSDDYTSLWGFRDAYTYFRATSGDHLDPHYGSHYGSAGEGEIDGLAAPGSSIPEPSSLLLFASGMLGPAGYLLRKRR